MLEKKEHAYEKAVLVGLITKDQDEEKLREYMDELEFLAYTAGATVEKRFTQKMSQPDSRTFVGSGKAEEIRNYINFRFTGTAHPNTASLSLKVSPHSGEAWQKIFILGEFHLGSCV